MACAEGPRPYSENTTWGEVGRSGCVGWLVFNIAAFVARREATAAAQPPPGADPLSTASLGDAVTMARIAEESLRGLPLRGMYNLGMLSDKALRAVVLWLNGRYASLLMLLACGRVPGPPSGPAGDGPPGGARGGGGQRCSPQHAQPLLPEGATSSAAD